MSRTQIVCILYVDNHHFVCMNVGSNCKTSQFKRHSEVLLNWIKTAFVNTVYKLFKRLFSYTRANPKLGFGKTSFVNTAVKVLSMLNGNTEYVHFRRLIVNQFCVIWFRHVNEITV